MSNWLSKLGLLVIAGFFCFLGVASIILAIDWTILIGILGTFWAVSVLIFSIMAFIIFNIIIYVCLLIIVMSFKDFEENVNTYPAK